MHLLTPRAANGSKSRSVPSRRKRELDRSRVVQKTNYKLSRSWSVRGIFSEAPKIILTLVPEVGGDEQDSVTESAGPHLVIDVAVSGRQETGALVAGELALSGTHAHTAVHLVRLSKLQGRAGPVFEDVLASVEEVRFAFPGWPQEAFLVCFVENGDDAAPASEDR